MSTAPAPAAPAPYVSRPGTRLLLAFGSLRSSNGPLGFNYRPEAQRHLRTLRIPGYTMISFGAYPAIVPWEEYWKVRGYSRTGGNLNPSLLGVYYEPSVTCELQEVNLEAYDHIEAMEVGAGYRVTRVAVDEGDAILFTYPMTPELGNRAIIQSGDWVLGNFDVTTQARWKV